MIMTIEHAPRELTEHEPAAAQRLDDHLIHDHGRAPHEITGLPLRAIHDLEHFDEAMGLLALRHSHTTRSGDR
jgi:hypothetical protein